MSEKVCWKMFKFDLNTSHICWINPSFTGKNSPIIHREAIHFQKNRNLKGNLNYQGISNWILHVLLYHYSKQHKISKTYSLLNKILLSLSTLLSVYCDLFFLRLSQRQMFDVFQFFDTVPCKVIKVRSDYWGRFIKNRVYNNFNFRYFVSSIIESLYKSISC